MLNKLLQFIRQYRMVTPGDQVICAVSGGADSMAMLFAMYLLAEKLDVSVAAAHFNHHLRGEESDRDAAFVETFCADYRIPFYGGSGQIVVGAKGLEAAARDARYAFLKSLPGIVATAHTADDNAETVLMHLIRGTGLKGLGGITPVADKLIRPMLSITRCDILSFLEEYSIPYVEDSSNATDQFLRNRLRHHVMPLLRQENPRLAENVSAMALRLREDEAALTAAADIKELSVPILRKMLPSQRNRALAAYLERAGVREPEAAHIAQLERLVFSEKPSARANFPNGITIARNYETLQVLDAPIILQPRKLNCPGTTDLPELGLRVICEEAETCSDSPVSFTVVTQGDVILRARASGDTIRLPGGTKTLKKLFVDRKIPVSARAGIPVIADDAGVIGVYGIGMNRDRIAVTLPAIRIRFEHV